MTEPVYDRIGGGYTPDAFDLQRMQKALAPGG